MKFANRNGSIFDVTNPALIPSYENNPEFKPVIEKVEKTEEPKKKTTTKK